MAVITRVKMKRGDLLPALTATLLNPDGSPFDLSAPGTAVKFGMALPGTAPKVNAAATILNAAAGQVMYSWSGTDTDTDGSYEAEFQVKDNSGKARTFPNDGYFYVDVLEDVAS